jgi:uncharacterized protein
MAVTDTVVRQLHARLVRIADMESQLERGPKLIQNAQMMVQAAKDAFQACKNSIKTKRMDADRKQLQQKEREAKIHDLSGKMNAAKANREYQSLKEQIAADTQANSVLSDEIFETLEEIDVLQESLKGLDEKVSIAESEATKTTSQIQNRLTIVQGDLSVAKSELAETLSALPSDFVSEFERLFKSRGADAFTELDGESCGGCHNAVPPRVRDLLRQGQPFLCPSCGRMLYRPE